MGQRNHLAPNPILNMATLALAIGAFILTVTGSLWEAFDLALSREAATVPTITVRPLSAGLTLQEAIIRKLWRVEGVQGVTATLRGSFKPEEERHNPTTRLPDTIQGTWSDLPELEFPLPSGKFSASAALTGRLPQTALSPLTVRTSSVEGSAGNSELSNEAVIGYELAQRLDKKIGDTLVVNEHPLVIVGIWQPSVFSPGNVVQVPYDTIRQWLPQSESSLALSTAEGFDEMTVIVAPGYDAEAVARRLWDQVPQVEVLSPAQERAERQWAMLALDLVVLYSVLLTVLVGGVTTLNTTLTATHEPPATSHQPSAISHPPSAISYQPSAISHPPSAIRHPPSAIGHPPSAIRHPPSAISYQLVQPLLAALAGGLAGLLAGWLAALGLDAYTVHNQARTLFIVTPRLAGGVVLLSVLVGFAAGVWPTLWTRLRSYPPHSSSFILPGLAVLGVALATPGVMLIGSLVESLYCSLDEGQRVAANRIGLEPTSSQVAYSEPLTYALRRWPGILDIAVEVYGGAIIEDEERWIDRLPPSGIFYGLCSALSPALSKVEGAVEGPALSPALSKVEGAVEGPERGDFGLGVPYRVGLWQGRVFQPGSLNEAVIGYDLAAQQGLKVGDTLTIRDHDFTVVGIRQRLVYGRMNDFNLRAEVSLEALRRVLGQPYAFGTITVFIPPAEREEDREPFLDRLVERFSGTAVVTVKDRLAEIARDFPGIKSLVVESSDDTLLRGRLLYFGLLAGVSVSLWGLAGLGIMSGLRLSLAESRQEIQLRKLFGASDGDIMARCLERAALWGVTGGLMGVGSGWLAIEAVNLCTNSYRLSAISHQLSAISHQSSAISHQLSAMSHQLSAMSHQLSAISHQLSAISYQQALTLIVTPRLVVTTLVVTVLLGVIAGLGPAWQAARLGPLWEN